MKISFEEAKKEFADRGYELLDIEYKDSRTPLRYKCPKHLDKELKIRLYSLKAGCGCYYCGREKTRAAKRIPFEEVKKEFEKRQYVLLEDEYINDGIKMRYICNRHPDKISAIKLNHLKSGHGCPYCKKEKLREKNLKYEIESVKQIFEKRGYILLEEEYVTNDFPMKFCCPKHPEENLTIRLSDLLKGQGCRLCGVENRSRENAYNWKGGTSSLTGYLRTYFKQWISEALVEHDFTCVITKEKGCELEVHHPYPFHKLRDKALQACGLNLRSNISEYTSKELSCIVLELREIHNQFKGIPLKKEVHQLFHKIYGYDTTLEDFYEFKTRYEAKEFNLQHS